jgi:GNAT superfamily N-acetyltransferase
MQINDDTKQEFRVYPATAERWPDLETLFGPNGASAGCWCMWWRLTKSDFKQLKGEGRKAMLREMTCKGQTPGLLAYHNDRPVGWCSIGRRENYILLENSRFLKRIDDQPVWSIVCFYVARAYRRKGVMSALLRGAVEYARGQGAKIIESYPADMQSPKLTGKRLTHCGGYMGIASVFKDIGFVEVGRASDTQLIMRYYS